MGLHNTDNIVIRLEVFRECDWSLECSQEWRLAAGSLVWQSCWCQLCGATASWMFTFLKHTELNNDTHRGPCKNWLCFCKKTFQEKNTRWVLHLVSQDVPLRKKSKNKNKQTKNKTKQKPTNSHVTLLHVLQQGRGVWAWEGMWSVHPYLAGSMGQHYRSLVNTNDCWVRSRMGHCFSGEKSAFRRE